MNMGQITNHMSVDAQCLLLAMQWFHYTWSTAYLVSMSGGSMNMGQITNHMSVDAQCMLLAMQWFHYTWSTPYLVRKQS